MFTALTVATLASHLGGPGFGFGFLLLFLIPLFFFGLFVLFASIGRRRWMRAGGYGVGGARTLNVFGVRKVNGFRQFSQGSRSSWF